MAATSFLQHYCFDSEDIISQWDSESGDLSFILSSVCSCVIKGKVICLSEVPLPPLLKGD